MNNIKLNTPALLTMFTCAELTDEQLATVRGIKAKKLFIKDGKFSTEISDDALYGSQAIIEYMKMLGYDKVPGCIREIAVDEILSLAENWEQLKDFVFFIDRIHSWNKRFELLAAAKSPIEVMMNEARLLNDAVEDLWFGNSAFLRDDGTKRTCLMELG